MICQIDITDISYKVIRFTDSFPPSENKTNSRSTTKMALLTDAFLEGQGRVILLGSVQCIFISHIMKTRLFKYIENFITQN